MPGFDYFRDDQRRFDDDQVLVRIDQKLSDKSFLYGRYAYNNELLRNPNLDPNWNLVQGNIGQNAGGHYTYTISPNILFESTVAYSRFKQNEAVTTAFQNDITNQILKIQGMATIPDSWGAPVWTVSGFTNLGEVHYGPRRWQLEIYQWHPAMTFNKGPHTLRAGVEFKRHLDNFDEIFRTNGIWTFDGRFTGQALGDFLLGLPASVNSSPDPFFPLMRYTALAPYFQDDWKVSANLTINLGLRYEWMGVPRSSNKSISNLYFGPNNASPQLVVSDGATAINYKGTQESLFTGIPTVQASSVGLPPSLAFNDNKDFAPRLGFAYNVPWIRNMVIRGGYGIFYQRDIVDKWVEASVNPPFVRSNNTVLDQTNFQTFNWFNPTVGASSASAQVFANGSNFRAGLLEAWNLALEKSLAGFLFSAAYVANRADHLPMLYQPNQAAPGPGSIQSRRRWPDWGTIYLADYDGLSSYESGQFKVQRPFSHGFSMLAGYTYSRCLDNTGGTFVGEADRGNDFQNSYNMRAEWGLCAQDIRHRFVVSYVYELPFGKGKPLLNRGGASNAIFGGWQVNGITSAQTGSPFTVLQTVNGANGDGGQEFRPDLIGNANDLSHSRPRGQQVAEFFDVNAFRMNVPPDPVNGPFRYGTEGRHVVIGPGIYDWDFAVYKDWRFTEQRRLQFRTEFFNIFNRPIFAQPGATLGTPQFGILSATSVDSREIQMALKVYF